MNPVATLFPQVEPLTEATRSRFSLALLAAAFVVASVELQRHWGSESTPMYVAVLSLIGLTGLGMLARQAWVTARVGLLIDVIIFAQLLGGIALTRSQGREAGLELLHEMLFWAPLVCGWWAVFYCGRPRRIVLHATLLYAGLFLGSALDNPGRFVQEYLIQGALAIALVTMVIGQLARSPVGYRSSPAAYDAVMLDPLTGVASRVCFEAELDLIAAIAERHQVTFSLIMVMFGGGEAEIADAELRSAAWQIVDAVRQSDTVCRWDQARFVVLLPETNEAGARRIAETLQGKMVWALSVDDIKVPVHIGVCEHRFGDDPMVTFAAVERAVADRAGQTG